MVRQLDLPPDGETSGPSLRTLAVVALGGVLAVGAAFLVRPSPKIDDAGPATASVVPAAVLTLASKTEAAATAHKQVAAVAPMAPAKQELARAMTRGPDAAPFPRTRAAPIQPAPATAPAVAPGVSSFAPPPERPGAMQALASMAAAPPAPVTQADITRRKQMADEAAKAIRDGDIPAARTILEKSIAAGDEDALMALAETYDPAVLAAMKVDNVASDSDRARELYEKAQAAGVDEARKRLSALKRYERRH